MVSGNNVLLKWITITELNNAGFEIERTAVNTERLNWKNIGFVKGNGTTNHINEYSFQDYIYKRGFYKYRIKQIDLNGAFTYLPEIEIHVILTEDFSLSQNYPNPFNPFTNINFTIGKPVNVTLKIFDILGNEITTLVNEERQAGDYKINFNAEGISSGIYYYQLKAGNFISAKKMILVR